MLLPKRVKYRRQQRGRMKGKATRGNFVAYGDYGLMATEPAWITSNQIEAARVAINRCMKRGGNVWIKIFPDKPVTQKPAETRMGSGKGSRCPASPRRWPRRRFVLPATSCPARPRSSPRRARRAPLPPRTSLRWVVNKMKAAEIRNMSATELETKLVDLKKDLFMLRMQHATNHLDNPVKISAVRRDIARVKTVLREKQS